MILTHNSLIVKYIHSFVFSILFKIFLLVMTTQIIEGTDEKFYNDAANYWSEIPATVDGMLGGFGYVSHIDIKESKMLLKQLFNSKSPPDRKYALDCGAGIGRIAKFLLTDFFEKVDLVEQNPTFLDQAKTYLGNKVSKVGNFYPEGLQNFRPQPKKYDVIWIQWVLGHLTDSDLICFLVSCQEGLQDNGVIVIKENITSTDDVEMDHSDSSVTRPMWLLRRIFDKANLECYRLLKQRNFPKSLFSVFMFVLKPRKVAIEQDNVNTDDSCSHNENVNNEKGINTIDENICKEEGGKIS